MQLDPKPDVAAGFLAVRDLDDASDDPSVALGCDLLDQVANLGDRGEPGRPVPVLEWVVVRFAHSSNHGFSPSLAQGADSAVLAMSRIFINESIASSKSSLSSCDSSVTSS